MKIKADFVTNSSSTSFILAIKTGLTIPKNILEEYPFLKSCGQRIQTLVNSVKATSIDELNSLFTDEYCYYDTLEEFLQQDEYYRIKYDDCVEYIHDGYRIATIDVEYGQEDVIYDLADGDSIIIVDKVIRK